MEEQLTELLKKINDASPLVWEIALRQVQVKLITNLIIFILDLGLIIVGCIMGRSLWKRYKFGGSGELVPLTLLLISAAVLFLTVICLPLVGYEVLTGYLNPEWAAIDLILDKVSGY